ncbi:threonine synthase [Myxococcota bacterium]|nr:threonine synthase [Myxococcota bacterium]
MATYVRQLRCTLCGSVEAPGGNEYTCAKCGPLGIRDVELDYEAIARVFSRETLASTPEHVGIRRYLPLLPVDPRGPLVPLQVGLSPIYDVPRLARDLGVARAWVKNDGVLPTASMKDRASWVGVARAVQQGAPVIAAASTGNAGTSVAGLAASMGIAAHIFIPASAPEAKVAQLGIYGAKLFLVKANYDRTYDLCQQAVAKFGWYNRSAAVNPYLVEGKKTCGHEIAEQLAGSMPDWVAMSVGDGCSIAATYKGMKELARLGITDRVPRMLAVQAEGASPLVKSWKAGTEAFVTEDDAHTVADSINVGCPRNPVKALRAVRESNGAFVAISDQAIMDWMPRVARTTGVFAEPTAVAAIAGIEEARRAGIIGPGESVLAVITGNGLKDVKNAMRAVAPPAAIEPDLSEVERLVGAR